MMVERHYDEESLIALLHAGDASAASDPHLSGCTSCMDMLDSYRVISEVLGAKIVWEPQEASNEAVAARGVAAIRAFATAMESEDAHAVTLVTALLSSPRQWWVTAVERDERYHTAGVVRRLIEVSEAKIDTMPPDAVEAAAAAIAVTRILDDSDSLLQLRGSAYRQHAYSLFYVGDFGRALQSVELGQEAFDRCPVSEYAVARLNIVRALIYRAQERFGEALTLARQSGRTFRAFGDIQRLVSAMMTETYLLMHAHNYRDALPVLLDIESRYSAMIDLNARAGTLHNIGLCYQHLGRLAEAMHSLQFATVLYDEAGTATEAARVRYSVALLLATEGKRSEAKARLQEVKAAFERLGMVHTAVVAGLDLAELVLLENNFKEVEEICRIAMRQFESASVAHLSEALTALTFLREAAEQRRATQETVWHVRTYLRRLPDEPALLFAPAPLPPT